MKYVQCSNRSRSKRGISPLYAVIITVAIVLVAGSLVGSIFVNNTQVINGSDQLNIQSANLVRDSDGNVAFSITIKNTGTKPITSLTVQLFDEQSFTIATPTGRLQQGKTASATFLPTGAYILGEIYSVTVEAASSGGSSFAH
jgi:flagellin-like protein